MGNAWCLNLYDIVLSLLEINSQEICPDEELYEGMYGCPYHRALGETESFLVQAEHLGRSSVDIPAASHVCSAVPRKKAETPERARILAMPNVARKSWQEGLACLLHFCTCRRLEDGHVQACRVFQ